jgi:hypothetical protein
VEHGTADDPIGHDNQLGSRLGDEGQHFFRNSVIVAEVGRPPESQRRGSVGSASSAGTMPTEFIERLNRFGKRMAHNWDEPKDIGDFL